MSYSLLSRIAQWEVIFFIGGMGILILLRMLTGEINTRYLLWGRRNDGTRYFSPERVQLLLATIAIAIQYVLQARKATDGNMPTLPSGSLELLGLSNATYLAGKGWMMLRRLLPSDQERK